MSQEWWSINVWLSRIWTKLLFVRASVEIVTYETTQVHNNSRMKIGSSTLRLDCRYQKTRGWQTEQISEFSMEIFPEIGINIFHFYLFTGVCWLLLSRLFFFFSFFFMWRSEEEMKYTWVFLLIPLSWLNLSVLLDFFNVYSISLKIFPNCIA